jgi:outer membrane protein assembly factor BamB
VLSVSTSSAAVDHSWVSVTTTSGEPGGGGVWGWGGIAITPDGHVWAASANANAKDIPDEAFSHAESVVELSSALNLLHASHAPGMPHRGDFGFGSTPIVFHPAGCGQMVTAEGKEGALYLWRRATLGGGPLQRLVIAFPATLYGSPAWDPLTQQLFVTTTQGYNHQPAGLDAFAITKTCRVRRVWTRSLGGQLSSVPTVVNNTVVVATGTGHLRVYATATGKLVAQRELSGAAFAAPIAIGGDVAAVTWNNRLLVYRLAQRAKR